MDLDFELIEQRRSEECGCPEEEFIIGMCYFTAHLEENGSCDLFLDMGDWDDERTGISCDGTVEGMRQKAREWAEEIHNAHE